MFGYKSVLKLKTKDVVTSEIELADFCYESSQVVDGKGKPQGRVRMGMMRFRFANIPTTELFDWMINTRRFKDGSVTVYDAEGIVIQRLDFSSAACVDMSFSYADSGEKYADTTFSIVAKKMTVDDFGLENEWKNV
ncbi:MAG: type VI secretion system needle protein Hcp [Paludibacteraceae bacterium]|nr:type VI secretion system needle protein Hcp [Paludibacteraceae bacterium]